jgi:AcrR family transcriptional regulator
MRQGTGRAAKSHRTGTGTRRKVGRGKAAPKVAGTKERLVAAGVDLFRQQGLNATGIKEILSKADARFSSLYHHFPGGKDELAAEVIEASGAAYQALVEETWDAQSDTVNGVREIFEGAADLLEATDYADACPIATVALEVAGTNNELRLATADVFEAWISSATSRLTEAGATAGDARTLAHTIIAMLEGAFILCRTMKDTDPMRDAARVAATLVAQALPGVGLGEADEERGNRTTMR